MSWMTTWPSDGVPTYREHATEQQAAAHAEELVRSKTSAAATYFELDGLEASA